MRAGSDFMASIATDGGSSGGRFTV